MARIAVRNVSARAIPQPRPVQHALARGGRKVLQGEVGPRREQHQRARQRQRQFPQAQRRGNGQAAAGRIAGNDEVAGRDSLGEQAATGGHRIVQRCRERMLGRETVVGGKHTRAAT